MKEAIERTFEPPEVHHERLFIISVLGFLVNLIGIFVFQHGGQAHHHHGGSCSHSHSKPTKNKHAHSHHEYKYDNVHGYTHYSNPVIYREQTATGAVALDMNGYSPTSLTKAAINNNHQQFNYSSQQTNPAAYSSTTNHHHANHGHQHSHGDHTNHEHHHFHNHQDEHDHPLIDDSTACAKKSNNRGQIMQSVLLHIIADTLGSIGVMISAVLMNQFGWMIADPICSLFIAILISVSVYPLLRDAIYILMQRVPVDIEHKIPDCLIKIQSLNGVLGVHEPHFWTLNSDNFIGCLKLEAAQGADYKYILNSTKNLLNQLGIERVHIQIDSA